MRAPQTKTLLFLAVGLFALTAISIPGFYPAPIPVLNPDGIPLLKADGSPLVHRDMTAFYKHMLPALIFTIGSISSFGWWLVRVAWAFPRKPAKLKTG